jgi:hypothetical protein
LDEVEEKRLMCKYSKIDEHGSSLSRQQRAKQARVDVNLNYSGSNRDQRQQQQQQQQQQQRNNNSQVRLTAEDFPVINGSSSSVPLLTNQMASLQIKRNGQEEWPSLGNEGRSSPNVVAESSSSSNAQPGIISRQAAAFDRIADMFKNLDKMIKFRQYIKQYTVDMSMNSEAFVNSVHKLCDKNNVIAQKVFDQTKDLISNDAQKIDMERAWNHKKNPVSILICVKLSIHTLIRMPLNNLKCLLSIQRNRPTVEEVCGIRLH